MFTKTMGIVDSVKNLLTGFLQTFGADWWVEITTGQPRCTYYFGPFPTSIEAKAASPGYVEDLEGEGARGIQVVVKRCRPDVLTIFDEDTE